MSANTYLIDALTRRQIFLQRYAGSVVNDLLPILDKMSRDVRLRLLDASTDFQAQRLGVILREINELITASGDDLGQQLSLELTEFAQDEAGFSGRLLNEVLTVNTTLPAPEQLAAAVTNTAARIVQGDEILELTVPEMVQQFTSAKRRQVTDLIRAGFIEGRTLQEMVREVTDITDKTAKRQAGAMIRTAVNHMGTTARQATYRQNRGVIDSLERTGTLDGRTSLQCLANDGRIYPIDTTDLPPYHFSCRTVMVPRVKEGFTLFRGKGQRASKDGPVNAQLTYSGFLKRQSEEFQNEVLGVERAQLFRSGKVTLDKFVDDQGRTLTLAELREREGLTLK